MTDELTQCIETGKITQEAAAKLLLLSPGAYCTHRSWGFGQIAEWRLLTDQIIIDFKTKKNHPMQLQYAADTLEFIPQEHILARVATDSKKIKEEAKKDPVSLMRSILKDHHGAATVEEITADLVPDVFSATDFKKWFDTTKKKLKADGHFLIPTKKTAPIELQEAKVEPHHRLLEQFRAARHPKEQVTAIDAVLKLLQNFAGNVEELTLLSTDIEEAAKRGGRIHATKTIELLLARDEVLNSHEELKAQNSEFSVASLLIDSSRKLTELFSELPSVKYRRVLAVFPEAFKDQWSEFAQQLLRYAEPRLIGEVFNLFQQQERREDFTAIIVRSIRERSATSDLLKWICEERAHAFSELINEELFAAILSALEREMHGEAKKGARLHELLFDDRQLMSDFFGKTDLDTARNSIRKIMISPVFNDLDRRSLLARILKVHPDLQAMITSDQEREQSAEREESIVVSWASLERRKKEYEHLVNKLIPQNTKDISIARSYGDLRENFEFKSAKEQQTVLLRQKAEMEQMLSNARGTNFENPDTNTVSIGTVITLKDVTTNKSEVYTLLGAWDSLPEKGWVSYQAAIGKALLGHKCGDTVELPDDNNNRLVIIEKIVPFADIAVLDSI